MRSEFFVIDVTISDALQAESMSPSDGDQARTMDSRLVALIVDADESSRIINSELLQHAGFHTLAMSTRRLQGSAVEADHPLGCAGSGSERDGHRA
jgi:hypothetical protein